MWEEAGSGEEPAKGGQAARGEEAAKGKEAGRGEEAARWEEPAGGRSILAGAGAGHALGAVASPGACCRCATSYQLGTTGRSQPFRPLTRALTARRARGCSSSLIATAPPSLAFAASLVASSEPPSRSASASLGCLFSSSTNWHR